MLLIFHDIYLILSTTKMTDDSKVRLDGTKIEGTSKTVSQKGNNSDVHMEAYVEPTTKKAKKDAEKDDMKPKKALSAYLIFINENRDAMKKDHPEETMTGLSKLLAERWNGMGAEDKVEWNEKAEADKVRYSNELNEYNLHKSMLELKKPPPKIEEEPAEPETGDTAPAEEAEEKTES